MNYVEVEDYNLELTLYPSFTLTLFRKVDSHNYIKVYGYEKGLILKQEGSKLFYKGDYQYVMLLSGLWYDPHVFIDVSPKSVRGLLSTIVEHYGIVRLSISPEDYQLLLIAVVLSRRTDYHTNVINWCKAIFSNIKGLMDILKLQPNLIRSYQFTILRHIIEQLNIKDKDVAIKPSRRIWELRRNMLKLKHVGPKTVDAYLLFACGYTFIAPFDVHFKRFITRFNIVKYDVAPSKTICSKYLCPNCPYRHKCISWNVMERYGLLSGWLQTIAYIHDKNYCSKRKCDECSLKHLCYGLSEVQ